MMAFPLLHATTVEHRKKSARHKPLQRDMTSLRISTGCIIFFISAKDISVSLVIFTHALSGGVQRLAITIERANLDYRKPLDRPVFCVSLHSADGRPLESPQDTPPGHFDRGRRCVAAEHTVILRTPKRQMPPVRLTILSAQSDNGACQSICHVRERSFVWPEPVSGDACILVR